MADRAKTLPTTDLVWMHEWADDAEVQAYRDAARVSGELRKAMRQVASYLAAPHRVEAYVAL